MKRVVYAASSSAYGDTSTLPKRKPCRQSYFSLRDGQAGQQISCSVVFRCYGFKSGSLRYFNVFGPRQDPTSPYSGMLAKFINQMLRSEPPTNLGDGKQSRDFTYIDNVVAANLLACTPRAAGRIMINVATGRRTDLPKTSSS